jgi:hypothetical protein
MGHWYDIHQLCGSDDISKWCSIKMCAMLEISKQEVELNVCEMSTTHTACVDKHRCNLSIPLTNE